MSLQQRVLMGFVLVALPLAVAWFDLGVLATLLLVVLVIVLRQLLVLTSIMKPPAGAEWILETIPPSHFAEKVRWCMDRLDVPYQEQVAGGVLGAFLAGRPVPRLSAQTGRTRSTINESSHILRYLYGRFAGDEDGKAAFLEPTTERLQWEARLDRYGVSQQVWVYHHLLKEPALCKQAWGISNPRVPRLHRWGIAVLYPLLEMLINRGFQPTQERYAKAVTQTEALLADTEKLLSDGRKSLLSGDEPDFVDITLASLSALWVLPDEFDRGRYVSERVETARMPQAYRQDRDRWMERFPATTAHIQRLFEQHRLGK